MHHAIRALLTTQHQSKILHIYLTEGQQAREGTQAGGVEEEEAGSHQRSLMRGLIPEHRDHVLSRRQTLNR